MKETTAVEKSEGSCAIVGANRREARERASQCEHILDAIAEELGRLEQIRHLTSEDLDAFSMAKGFVQRAKAVLGGRFV